MQAVVERRRDVAVEDAQAELVGILDAIAAEQGMTLAHAAALGLSLAAAEGRIDGGSYLYTVGGEARGCAMVHLWLALGGEGVGVKPSLPGWDRTKWRQAYEVYSPLERWVEPIRPGHVAATVPDLASLVEWCDNWLATHPAV